MVTSILKRIYDRTLRPVLPRKIGMHAGVAIRTPRLFDATDNFPNNNKEKLMDFCRDGINTGDSVIVIGGGLGMSAVATARATGQSGSVSVYEAGQQEAKRLTETMELNAVADWVSVHHAVVGDAISVNGKPDGAEIVAPTDLPPCDVLQLDCEGAERQILSSLSAYPETIIVETHPRYGAPTDDITAILTDSGYTINRKEPDPVAGDLLLATRSE